MCRARQQFPLAVGSAKIPYSSKVKFFLDAAMVQRLARSPFKPLSKAQTKGLLDNPDLVAPLLADKFVSTGSDGKVASKAEMLATAKATKYDSVSGDTAIATGGFTGKFTDPSGKLVDANERWTDTWVKMPSGKWQCVASYASSLKM